MKRTRAREERVPVTRERAIQYLRASRDLKRAYAVALAHEAQMFESICSPGRAAGKRRESQEFGNGSVLLDLLLVELMAPASPRP